ncbi:BREX-1 system adenine-specific DNA-methyltransferase PglX, partial [uncultured Selenomonas sp.]|uniref:BREX-1 system adenine-specific DNA-methyltransferase PglX n=1 Tax=uncultured Selenomonas sp. TaxID=159275 RepID=UPI0028DC18B5
NKGGEYRLWYGNLQEVLWFDEAGRNAMNSMSGHRENGGHDFYFRDGITWTFISSSNFGVRYLPHGALFDVAGSTLFTDDKNIKFILGFLSSVVCSKILSFLNPTLNYQAGNIKNLPIIRDRIDIVDKHTDDCVKISQQDWDAFETSWDFACHPIVQKALSRPHGGGKDAIFIEYMYRFVAQDFEERFTKLKANEEELNSIFIDIYGLTDELTPEVEDRDVTVSRIFDTKEEIPSSMKGSNYAITKADVMKSFISYAVGCMFGRYSLDMPGLVYAGGEWDDSKYTTFLPDEDAILPICDDEYFDDDIVGRFVEFIEAVFGKETLEENLQFIADALGGRGSSREVIRSYFLTGFYADHVKTYQKRPIYWLFDSGKKNGFKCLVYMHRYCPDTIARIRTDYVHEQQSRYRTAIESLEQARDNAATAGDKVKAGKKLAAVEAQAKELLEYEEKIHHLADQMIAIDLDDGVKHNHAIFQDVLAKIK